MIKFFNFFVSFQRFFFSSLFTIFWLISVVITCYLDPIYNLSVFVSSQWLYWGFVFVRLFALGIPLFLVCDLLCVHKKFISYRKWVYFSGGALLLLYFFYNIFDYHFFYEYMRLNQQFYSLFIAINLLVCVSPFLYLNEIAFWKFNNVLFVKLKSMLVLCLGIFVVYVIGVFLLDVLFFENVNFYFYQLGAFLSIGVGNFYFFSQIPLTFSSLERLTPYPKFYYLVTTYFLFPFSVLFITMSYIYFCMYFLFDISFFIEIIICVLIGLGMSLFLIFQIEILRFRCKNKFYLFLYRYFYVFILPSILLSICFIWLLFEQEGITEFWYVCYVLLFWVLSVVIYFLFSKVKDLRFVFITLFLVMIFFSIDMFSPYTISTKSQYHRLLSYFRTYELLDNKKLVFNVAREFTIDDRNEIKWILLYLDERQRLSLLKDVYPYRIIGSSLSLERIYFDLNL